MENKQCNKLYGEPRVIRFSNLTCCTVVLASIPPAAFLRPQQCSPATLYLNCFFPFFSPISYPTVCKAYTMEYIGKATEVVKHFRVRLSHCSSAAQQLRLGASRFDWFRSLADEYWSNSQETKLSTLKSPQEFVCACWLFICRVTDLNLRTVWSQTALPAQKYERGNICT